MCYLHTTKDVPDGIVSINHKVGHIEHLFVTEKARGRGIGMKMLDFARRKLSEHEHPVLSVLNTNTRAIALYTRMGWKLTSGTELEFTPEQYPAVVKKVRAGLDAVRGQRTEVTPGGSCRLHRTAKKARKWMLGPEGMVQETHKKRPRYCPMVEKMLKTFVSTL